MTVSFCHLVICQLSLIPRFEFIKCGPYATCIGLFSSQTNVFRRELNVRCMFRVFRAGLAIPLFTDVQTVTSCLWQVWPQGLAMHVPSSFLSQGQIISKQAAQRNGTWAGCRSFGVLWFCQLLLACLCFLPCAWFPACWRFSICIVDGFNFHLVWKFQLSSPNLSIRCFCVIMSWVQHHSVLNDLCICGLAECSIFILHFTFHLWLIAPGVMCSMLGLLWSSICSCAASSFPPLCHRCGEQGPDRRRNKGKARPVTMQPFSVNEVIFSVFSGSDISLL